MDLNRIVVDWYLYKRKITRLGFNLCAVAAKQFFFLKRVASYQKSQTEMKTSTQSRGKMKLLYLIALC